jgi:hypothetical protein
LLSLDLGEEEGDAAATLVDVTAVEGRLLAGLRREEDAPNELLLLRVLGEPTEAGALRVSAENGNRNRGLTDEPVAVVLRSGDRLAEGRPKRACPLVPGQHVDRSDLLVVFRAVDGAFLDDDA